MDGNGGSGWRGIQQASAKPELIDAFAVELLARRQELNLSQDEVANRAEIDRAYISKLESKAKLLARRQELKATQGDLASRVDLDRPNSKQPSLSILHTLAEALEMSFSEFAGRIDHRYVVLKRAAKRAASADGSRKAPAASTTRRKTT